VENSEKSNEGQENEELVGATFPSRSSAHFVCRATSIYVNWKYAGDVWGVEKIGGDAEWGGHLNSIVNDIFSAGSGNRRSDESGSTRKPAFKQASLDRNNHLELTSSHK